MSSALGVFAKARNRLLDRYRSLTGPGETSKSKVDFAPAWTPAQQEFWERNGYLVLPGYARHAKVKEVNDFVDDLWTRRIVPNPSITIDAYIGEPQERRLPIEKTPADARTKPYKLNDLYMVCPAAREVILDARLVAILRTMLGDLPVVCNSLNFERGSQQEFHTDTLYMPAPSGLGTSPVQTRMLATWIALEDAASDAGPLWYYPGSHLIPPYRFSHGSTAAIHDEMPLYRAYMQTKIVELGLKPTTFDAKSGDILIWHELLYHGGSAITNLQKTRRSLVTHYFQASDVPFGNRKECEAGYVMDRAPHAPHAFS